MPNCEYVILPVEEVTDHRISCCVQTSENTLRLNIAETHAVMKYNGEKPVCLESYADYTHAEILPIMHGSEWTEEIDE